MECETSEEKRNVLQPEKATKGINKLNTKEEQRECK
jgi:hypothetical protein